MRKNPKKHLEQVKEWQKSRQVVYITKEAYQKYTEHEQLPLAKFIARCIDLYLTEPTFKALVHGCTVAHKEDLTN